MERAHFTTPTAWPRVWALDPQRFVFICQYPECATVATRGVGYDRPVRKFCTDHFYRMLWLRFLDELDQV